MRKLAIEKIIDLWTLGFKGDYWRLGHVVATCGSIDLNDPNVTIICSPGKSFKLTFNEKTGLEEYLSFLDDSDIFQWLISITEESVLGSMFSQEGKDRLMDYFGV